MLSAGLTGCCFRLDGGPPAPHEEMFNLVDELIFALDVDDVEAGDVKEDGATKNPETVATLKIDVIAREKFNFILMVFLQVYLI